MSQYHHFYNHSKVIQNGITTQNNKIESINNNGNIQVKGLINGTTIHMNRKTPKRVKFSPNAYSSHGITFRKTPYINKRNRRKQRKRKRKKKKKELQRKRKKIIKRQLI